MPLINTSVPNLIQGVSQQSDATRFAGQCEEQENALSSVAEGLKKRPHTKHIAKLIASAISTESFIHFINRSETEKYVIIHDGTNLRAFNILDGSVATINGASSLAVTDTYLDSNPEFFKALTLGDNTILLNSSRVTSETANRTPVVSSEALVFVKQGDYGTKYSISLQGNFQPQAGSNAAIAAPQVSPTGSNYYLNGNPVISDAGSGYEQGFVNIVASSNGSIIQQPTFNVIVDSTGAISTVSTLNTGVFGGVSTGSNTINHTFNVTNFTKTDNNDPYSSTYSHDYRRNFSFDCNITAGSTSHLTIGQSVSVTLDSSYFLEYKSYGHYDRYDDYTTVQQRTFTGTLVASNKVQVSVNYNYTRYPSIIATRFSGKKHDNPNYYSSAGAAWTNLFNGDGTGSFTSSQPTFGTPTVTLSISNPTTDVSVARIDAEITTPDSTNSKDFNDTGGLSNGNTNDRKEIDTSVIATALKNKIYSEIDTAGQESNFQVTSSNNLVIIAANAATMIGYTISAFDGLADGGLGIIYKEVGSINDLPLYCKNDFIVKVAGEQSDIEDDYYVKFQTNDGSAFGRGIWVETVGYDQPFELDNTTLPHLLVSVAPNEFKFAPADGSTATTAAGGSFTFSKWGEKQAGDSDTNPSPSFIGKTISNLLFFKNRLGFLTNNSVTLSEAGHFFNFFRTTVSTLIDSATIDIEVGSNRVTNLRASTPFQGNLVLFSDNEQFVLKGGDVLTPRTVSITAVTNFGYDNKVNPLALGSYIYFTFTRGNYTGLREFAVNSTTDTYDSIEVTEHVPSYIYKNISAMAGTTSEDTLVLVSKEHMKCLYVYKYFWNNNQKVLSSWSKFSFNDDIIGLDFIDSTLYMVMNDGENTHLVSLPLGAGSTAQVSDGFHTLLDKRVRAKVAAGTSLMTFEQSDGTYSGANADLPYDYFTGTVPAGGYALREIFVDSKGVTHAIEALSTSGVQVHLTNGNLTGTEDLFGYVGFPYSMKYQFSTQVFKAQGGKSASPTNAGEMLVRNGTMFFDDTHTFDVKVTSEGRPTATSTFLADDVPEAETIILEDYPLASGTDTKTNGTVWTRTSDSEFTLEVTSATSALAYDYIHLVTQPAKVGKYRMTFNLTVNTGSVNSIGVYANDADAVDNGASEYIVRAPEEGDNFIEFEVFDDGGSPQPQIFWRITTNSILDVSITNYNLYRLRPIKFAEGDFRFPIYSNAKNAEIVIENKSPFDCKFSSAEFESFVHPRSKRYG